MKTEYSKASTHRGYLWRAHHGPSLSQSAGTLTRICSHARGGEAGLVGWCARGRARSHGTDLGAQ